MRKTKIVCTLGPACDDERTLIRMIDAGMNVARVNMSHGTYEEQKVRFDRVKSAIAKSGKTVALLLDTKGPEVRVGTFESASVELVEGQEFSLYKTQNIGNNDGVSISYPRLVEIFRKDPTCIGRELLIDDGKISVICKDVTEDAIVCTVNKGGKISNRKSINIPNYHISMPFISKKDREDLEFGLKQGVDFVAASFVRSADDVIKLRDFIDSIGYEHVEIIAKIENQSGVDDIDRILEVANGIMVARGDMGVEIPFINLPSIQKTIIKKCVAAGKYVITATQMLESMTTSPRPTRAEISDVANAVYDGTSAVMLSGESAAGKYPVESVQALSDICRAAEKDKEYSVLKIPYDTNDGEVHIRETICRSARTIAERINAKAIIVESATGRVARSMAHYRPSCPIIAVVTSHKVCNKMSLIWGVTAVYGEEKKTSDAITRQAVEKALGTGLVNRGDTVIIISSNKTVPTAGTDSLYIRIV